MYFWIEQLIIYDLCPIKDQFQFKHIQFTHVYIYTRATHYANHKLSESVNMAPI